MPLAGYRNQRTNGPVNAHLISGPSVNTKHTKPEQTVNLITYNLSFTLSVYYTNTKDCFRFIGLFPVYNGGKLKFFEDPKIKFRALIDPV